MLTEPPDKVAAGAGALLEAVASANDEQELAALVLQLGQLRDQAALQSLASLRQHSSATVRRAVAEALPLAMVDGASASAGVEALIGLCSDDDAEVRDWAACSLGRSLAADAAELRAFYDTPEIRAALWARVADDDPATRAEACAGLALRHVGEVAAPLRRELGRADVGRVPVIAAEALGSADLYDSLLALRRWWTRDPELLERAMRACAPGQAERTIGSNHG
jgi:HEAT repeat protein